MMASKSTDDANGLKVNEGKTTYMLEANRKQRIDE